MGVFRQPANKPMHHLRSYFAKYSAALLLAGTLALSSCSESPSSQPKAIPHVPKRVERMVVEMHYPSGMPLFPYQHQLMKKDFAVLVGSDSLMEKGEKIASLVEEFNPLLPEKGRARVVLLTSDFGDSTLNNGLGSMGAINNTLFAQGDAPAFSSDKRLRWSVFHEMTHLYMDNCMDSAKGDFLFYTYVALTKAAKISVYDTALSYAKMGKDQYFGIFDESNYMKGSSPTYGHPHEFEWELFASGSTILKFAPQEFFRKLAKLDKKKPKVAQMVKDAARCIIQCWGEDRIFDPIVYEKLSKYENIGNNKQN